MNTLSGVHIIWVKSKVQSIRDDLFNFGDWPCYSGLVITKILETVSSRLNYMNMAENIMPQTIMANIGILKSVFGSSAIEADEVVTLDEFLMCSNIQFSEIFNTTSSNEYYYLTTKTGKIVVTMSSVVASTMTGQEENGMYKGFKYSLLKARVIEQETKVRPYRIQDNIMMCTGHSVFSSKLSLKKTTKVLHCDEFYLYAVDPISINEIKIENKSMKEMKTQWMLGVTAFSVGAVFDHNPSE